MIENVKKLMWNSVKIALCDAKNMENLWIFYLGKKGKTQKDTWKYISHNIFQIKSIWGIVKGKNWNTSKKQQKIGK